MKDERQSCCLLVCGECSPSFVLAGTMSLSSSDVGTRISASARTPSASASSSADGSILSYLYDLDDEEAAELFGACTPQVTDGEGSVESADQSQRLAGAGIPFCPSDLDDEEAAEQFGAYTPWGIDEDGFCECGGPRRAPATQPRQHWDAEGTGEFSEASTSSSDNSRWYERAARGLSSAGAPGRPILMDEEPLISRLERLKLGRWYIMETSDSD